MYIFLQEFWKWINMTPEEYDEKGLNQNKGEFEDNFPHFVELIEHARKIICSNTTDEKLIDELLTIMALDNEGEIILEEIIDDSSQQQLEKIVERGMTHLQNNARWQLTELLYEKRIPNYMEYLKRLSQDRHPYVRRRARNTINYILYGEGWDARYEKYFSESKFIKRSFNAKESINYHRCKLCLNDLGVGKLTEGYVTEDNKFLVCKTCFNDITEKQNE